MSSQYTIDIHRHNFAVWAAARAAQRGFTTVENLKAALEQCGITEYLLNSDTNSLTTEDYMTLHSTWCNSIVQYLDSIHIKGSTFGRAAKLIAIYVKSMVTVCNSESNLACIAYPPIDGVILKNISKDKTLPKDFRQFCTKTKWRQLDEENYMLLIRKLQKYVILDKPMWTLERYWSVIQS
jgi:hypothetical protein